MVGVRQCPGLDFLNMATTRSSALGPAARPVAIPEDFDSADLTRAVGKVELPLHIRWSGGPLVYDLEDPADLARVYEQVLREGTEQDVRHYVDPDQLLKIWDELVLPPAVSDAWAPWLQSHGRK